MPLVIQGYKTELFRFRICRSGIGKGGEDCFDLPKDSPDYWSENIRILFWIFPEYHVQFLSVGTFGEYCQTFETDLTKVSFINYIWKKSFWIKERNELDKVEREDEAIKVLRMFRKG
ncbi:MAG: hypothetical protein R2942_02735 [Ignavibacteria bacterium]